MKVSYPLAPRSHWQWCETHRRIATHYLVKIGVERPDLNPPAICCDPALAGVMLPCRTVPVEKHYPAAK